MSETHVKQIAPSCVCICVRSQAMFKNQSHRGQGGGWHAFVSLKTRGQSGKPDLGALAQTYNLLPEGDVAKQGALKLGADATKLRRTRGHLLLPFGPKLSKVRRRQRNAVHRAAAGRASCVGDGTLAMAGNIVSVDLAITNSDSRNTLGEKLAFSRRMSRCRHDAQARDENTWAESILKWGESAGKGKCRRCLWRTAWLGRFGLRFEAHPDVWTAWLRREF